MIQNRRRRLAASWPRVLGALSLVLGLELASCKAASPPPGPEPTEAADAQQASRDTDPRERALEPEGDGARNTPEATPGDGQRAFDAPFLRSLNKARSHSIGTASRGYLVGGVAMKTKGSCLRIRPSAARKKAIYGTAELVGALEQAACRVERGWPESRLFAGDLSAKAGGDLKGHASHNSGRDADLAFYMRDAAGRPADGPRMLPIGRDAKARWGGELRFDAARNWALVEGLLKNPRIQVQYLFVANHIRHMLLDHARKTDASADVLSHAQAVLRQPKDSSIHEEHFHLRIYCGLHERLEGCVDYGPVHPWIDTFAAGLNARVAEVLPFLRKGGAEEIEFAIVRIVRLRVAAAAEHLEPLKDHENSRIRALAGDAVAFLRGERTPPSWAHLTQEDPGE